MNNVGRNNCLKFFVNISLKLYLNYLSHLAFHCTIAFEIINTTCIAINISPPNIPIAHTGTPILPVILNTINTIIIADGIALNTSSSQINDILSKKPKNLFFFLNG